MISLQYNYHQNKYYKLVENINQHLFHLKQDHQNLHYNDPNQEATYYVHVFEKCS